MRTLQRVPSWTLQGPAEKDGAPEIATNLGRKSYAVANRSGSIGTKEALFNYKGVRSSIGGDY